MAVAERLGQVPAEKLRNWVWQLEVCNACRYCEGYCAVFPALERRRTFTLADIDYLANLCFDCRACYYACMFAPPHEFGVNIPQMLSEVRRETYARYALPAVFTRLLASNWLAVSGLLLLSALFFLAVVAATGDPGRLFEAHVGPGAFYRVLPYALMSGPALVLSLVGLVLLVGGGVRFWWRTRGSVADYVSLGALLRAASDALGLRYLTGGGAGGCTYPGERPSFARFVLHHLVFWGFISAFVATTAAYIQQDFLGWYPPYPWLSVPVITGSLGGIAMIVGCAGLLYLKGRSDREPADAGLLRMDTLFLGLLLLINVTGLALLLLRETPAMGSLLVLHLATVFALYFVLPYSKFAHFVYRYAALVQNRLEERREAARAGH
jgi:citrate/tricarballylate utilization protein